MHCCWRQRSGTGTRRRRSFKVETMEVLQGNLIQEWTFLRWPCVPKFLAKTSGRSGVFFCPVVFWERIPGVSKLNGQGQWDNIRVDLAPEIMHIHLGRVPTAPTGSNWSAGIEAKELNMNHTFKTPIESCMLWSFWPPDSSGNFPSIPVMSRFDRSKCFTRNASSQPWFVFMMCLCKRF